MKAKVFFLYSLFLSNFSIAEQFPLDFSKEPDCIQGTRYLPEDAIYIFATYMTGFTRKPHCIKNTICMQNHIHLTKNDYLQLDALIYEKLLIAKDERLKITMAYVMDNILIVNAHKPQYWGENLLFEKGLDKQWTLLRSSRWVE